MVNPCHIMSGVQKKKKTHTQNCIQKCQLFHSLMYHVQVSIVNCPAVLIMCKINFFGKKMKFLYHSLQ